LPLTIDVTCGRVITTGGSTTIGDSNTVFRSPAVTYTLAGYTAGGRLVYFSGLIEGLWRIDISSNSARGQPFIGPDAAFRLRTTNCVGCHSFSRTGGRMSFALNTPSDSRLGVARINALTPTIDVAPASSDQAIWTAMHPDGSFVLSTGF